MQCAYHPDKEAIAICVMCLKDICGECKVANQGMIYCKPCTAELFLAKPQTGAGEDDTGTPSTENTSGQGNLAVMPEAVEVNWFKRHLNWALVLGHIAAIFTAFILDIILEVIIEVTLSGFLWDVLLERLFDTGTFFVALVVFLSAPSAIWYLKRKGRSLWHLLWWWYLIPVSVAIMLLLGNKRT